MSAGGQQRHNAEQQQQQHAFSRLQPPQRQQAMMLREGTHMPFFVADNPSLYHLPAAQLLQAPGVAAVPPWTWYTHNDPPQRAPPPPFVNHSISPPEEGQHRRHNSGPRAAVRAARTPPVSGPPPYTHASNTGSSSQHTQPLEPTENLFICYLPVSITDHRLQQLVAQHGMVVSAKVMLDLNTKQSRGFGFALMASVADATRAKLQLDGMLIDGKRLQVRFAAPPASDNPTVLPPSMDAAHTNLYVKGIPLSWRDDAVTQFFSRFGPVASAVVLMEGRESKGIALVRLGTKEAVEAALRAAPLHVDGWAQPITVRLSRQQTVQHSSAAAPPSSAATSLMQNHSPLSEGVDGLCDTEPPQRQHTDQFPCVAAEVGVPAHHSPVPETQAQHSPNHPRTGSDVAAANRMIPGPFGLLLRMNNPYSSLPRSQGSPDGLRTPSAAATPTTVAGTSTPPLPTQNFAPLARHATSGRRRNSAPAHTCHYCLMGTTIRVYGAPTEQSHFERWVDELLSGFGAVVGKEVYANATALVTFVEPGAAHMAVQTLMYSDFQPEIFDCSQGLYVG